MLVSWPYSASTPNLVESAVAMPETGSVRHAVKTAATSRFVCEPLRWSMDGLSLSAATMLISSPEYAKGVIMTKQSEDIDPARRELLVFVLANGLLAAGGASGFGAAVAQPLGK